MSYRVRIESPVSRAINSWHLPDSVFVEVLLRLEGLRREYLVRTQKPFDGMTYGFSMIDPDNRLCEYHFFFLVLFDPGEQTLVVERAGHIRQMGF